MMASFTNSNATALCPVGACDLTLFPDPDPAIPGDYQAVGPGPNFANFDDGTKYAILPPAVIPLPATLPLALAGLGALALVRRRRP